MVPVAGEAVGLSSRKYTAALVMAVYALSTQEVEAIIGTKRSLISKWRTEPKFLQQMKELRSEFGADIFRVLAANNANAGLLSDAHYYSAEVRKLIVALGDDAAEKGDGGLLLRLWGLLRTVLIPA